MESAEFELERALKDAPQDPPLQKPKLLTLPRVWDSSCYSQENVHLPSWCPYWTSEINISGFQDSVHKHKLHFTFCRNREEKIPYCKKPQSETEKAC